MAGFRRLERARVLERRDGAQHRPIRERWRHPIVELPVRHRPQQSPRQQQRPVNLKSLHNAPFFQNGGKSAFEMCFGPSTLGAGAKTRLESRIKEFTPHCVCRQQFSPGRHAMDAGRNLQRLARYRWTCHGCPYHTCGLVSLSFK